MPQRFIEDSLADLMESETFMGFFIEESAYAWGEQFVMVMVTHGKHGIENDSLPVGRIPYGSAVPINETETV